MRRDTLIAIGISLLLYTGLACVGLLLHAKPAAIPPAPSVLELMPLPPIEPDQPPPTDSAQPTPADLSALVPPTQADIPSPVLDAPFVQQIEPPSPALTHPTALITIPTTHPGQNSGQGIGQIFDLANLDQTVGYRFQAIPVYPYDMKRAGTSGQVELAFIVGADGNARDIRVVHSTRTEFESAAVQSILQSKFTPGKKNGIAVNVRVTTTVSFKIQSDGS